MLFLLLLDALIESWN